MIGLDFLGPVIQRTAIEPKYVLIGVDYFSRFVWANAYSNCTMSEVIDFLVNHIAPIFGWPKAVYTDNGAHFMGKEIN